MNIEIANRLTNLLKLGKIIKNIEPLSGGLIHKMWKVETEFGQFAVKEINFKIALQPSVLENLEFCENISLEFHEAGINCICSIRLNNKSVIRIDTQSFLVYPFKESVDFRSLDWKISIPKITKELALVHNLNHSKRKSEPKSIDPKIHLDVWKTLENQFTGSDYEWMNDYVFLNTKIVDLYHKIETANFVLNQDLVLSHCDLDIKNVLWDLNGKPWVIDWESFSYINPTKEIVQFCLDWSESFDRSFQNQVLELIIRSYSSMKQIDQQIIELSFYSCLGDYLNWLKFNLQRLLNYDQKSDEYQIANIEVPKTVKLIINRIKKQKEYIIFINKTLNSL